jgi:hypothetical protein
MCPGWLQTMILLISASQVAKITGVSQTPAYISLHKHGKRGKKICWVVKLYVRLGVTWIESGRR